MRIRKKEVTLDPQGFSLLKSNTGASRGASFFGALCKVVQTEGASGDIGPVNISSLFASDGLKSSLFI